MTMSSLSPIQKRALNIIGALFFSPSLRSE